MKKLFALIMALAMLATMPLAVFAEESGTTTENQETTVINTTPGDSRTDVTYTVNPTYTVTIPTAITIDETAQTISAEDVVVAKGSYVSVALSEDNVFTVKTAEGAELTYTVKKDNENISAGGEILAVNPANSKTGSTTIIFDIDEADIVYAGTYTGTAIFTISVKDVPNS